MIIFIHHGEARAVVQHERFYEQLQERLALLQRLAQSAKSVQAGKVKPVKRPLKTCE